MNGDNDRIEQLLEELGPLIAKSLNKAYCPIYWWDRFMHGVISMMTENIGHGAAIMILARVVKTMDEEVDAAIAGRKH